MRYLWRSATSCGGMVRQLKAQRCYIKPCKGSLPEEKLDMDNGLLLCPNHDRLFDKEFISFEDKGMVKIS